MTTTNTSNKRRNAGNAANQKAKTSPVQQQELSELALNEQSTQIPEGAAVPELETLPIQEELKPEIQQPLTEGVEGICNEELAGTGKRRYWNPLTSKSLEMAPVYEDEVFNDNPDVRENAMHTRLRNQEVRMAGMSHALQAQAKILSAESLDLEGRISNIEKKVGIKMEQVIANQDQVVAADAAGAAPIVAKKSLLQKAKDAPLSTAAVVVVGATAVVAGVYVGKKVYDHYTAKSETNALEAMPAPVEAASADLPEALHY